MAKSTFILNHICAIKLASGIGADIVLFKAKRIDILYVYAKKEGKRNKKIRFHNKMLEHFDASNSVTCSPFMVALFYYFYFDIVSIRICVCVLFCRSFWLFAPILVLK